MLHLVHVDGFQHLRVVGQNKVWLLVPLYHFGLLRDLSLSLRRMELVLVRILRIFVKVLNRRGALKTFHFLEVALDL